LTKAGESEIINTGKRRESGFPSTGWNIFLLTYWHSQGQSAKNRKEEAVMKVTPLGDRIVVKPLEAREKTKGGIIIPDSAKEKPLEGKIIAVGKGRVTGEGKLVAPEVKTGDKVLYGKYSGTEIVIDGEEMLIVKEEDILAVLKD
jgi:chaperonin GroES